MHFLLSILLYLTEEYFNELVTALDLDSPTYSHVDPIIMQQFKGLLRKYPEAFYLPGTKLGTVKDFYHNIDTGQPPPPPPPLCTVFLIVRVQQSFVQSKVSCKRCSCSVLFSQVIPPRERHVLQSANLWKRAFHSPEVCCGVSRPKCYHVGRWVSNSIGFKHFGCPQWGQTSRNLT